MNRKRPTTLDVGTGGNPVVVDPRVVRLLGGDLAASILFCQFYFWAEGTDRPFSRTAKDVLVSTGLSGRQQARARDALELAGYINQKLVGANGKSRVVVNLCAAAFRKGMVDWCEKERRAKTADAEDVGGTPHEADPHPPPDDHPHPPLTGGGTPHEVFTNQDQEISKQEKEISGNTRDVPSKLKVLRKPTKTETRELSFPDIPKQVVPAKTKEPKDPAKYVVYQGTWSASACMNKLQGIEDRYLSANRRLSKDDCFTLLQVLTCLRCGAEDAPSPSSQLDIKDGDFSLVYQTIGAMLPVRMGNAVLGATLIVSWLRKSRPSLRVIFNNGNECAEAWERREQHFDKGEATGIFMSIWEHFQHLNVDGMAKWKEVRFMIYKRQPPDILALAKEMLVFVDELRFSRGEPPLLSTLGERGRLLPVPQRNTVKMLGSAT